MLLNSLKVSLRNLKELCFIKFCMSLLCYINSLFLWLRGGYDETIAWCTFICSNYIRIWVFYSLGLLISVNNLREGCWCFSEPYLSVFLNVWRALLLSKLSWDREHLERGMEGGKKKETERVSIYMQTCFVLIYTGRIN